jgi:uncharacterized LabA/DUF88 family protein
LTIKATQLSSKVDTIIIMSGDSDYVELVRHLKAEGVRVEIAALPSTTSRLLIEEADYFHEITSDDWFTLTPRKGMRYTNTRPKSSSTRQQPSPENSSP